MANVTAAAFKEFGDNFSNESGYVKLTYNFATDGGEADDVIRLGQCKKASVAKAIVVVETTCTSGGSATVAVGVEGGDVDAIMDTTDGAVANLTANSTFGDTATAYKFFIAEDGYIIWDIATADLTAGKAHVHIWYANAF